MIPLNRAGWLVGTLAIGFALGWSAGTLRGPQEVSGSPKALSGTLEPQKGVLALSNTATAALTEETPAAGGSFSSTDDAPGQAVGVSAALRDALKLSDSTDRLIRIREVIRTLSTDQIPEVFAQAKRLSQYDRWQVLSALGNRWAELDMEGALDFGLKNGRVGPYGGYNNFLHAAIEKWAGSNPSEAVAWVSSLPPGNERNELMTSMLSAVGRNDPQAAVQFLRSPAAAGWQGGWPVEQMFADWASRDPQAAATAALDLKDASAIRGTAQAWAQTNPHAAMAWAEKIPNAIQKKNVISAVVDQWSEVDPIGVISWSRNLDDDQERKSSLAKGISQLAGKDLSSALAQIGSLPAGEDRDQAVMAAAQSVGKKDARGALRLLEQVESGPDRTRTMGYLCETWAASEPREALDWLFRNATPPKGDYAVSRMVGQWATKSPDEALKWAQALPPGEKRETAMAGLAASLVYQDPARGQQLFTQLSPEAQASIADRFVSTFVGQDLEKARTWAESLPPGKTQASALGVIGYQMALKNVASAAQWVETLPPGRGRDQAVVGFSNHAVRRDPEGAVAWALTISDEIDRMNQIGNLMRQWMNTDSASARKWLNTTNQLTPAQRQRLQER